MSMLPGLERVLRSTGLEVEMFPGWRSRDIRSTRGLGFKEVRALMLHTSEGKPHLYRSGAEFPKIQDTLDRSGLHTYNVLIGRTGVLGGIAAGTGAHAGSGSWPNSRTRGLYPDLRIPRGEGNWYTIGIALDSNEKDFPPTREQLSALIKVILAFDRDWGEKLPVIMHGEYSPDQRTDPQGVNWDDIRRARDLGSWEALEREKAAQAGAQSVAGKPWEWVVRPGDSLWRIQMATGVKVATLKSLNGLSGSLIYPGQRLRLA